MSDDEWRDKLSAEEYRVCREKGTEAPFTGVYCGETLFESGDKYESGSGWPSFDRPAADGVIRYERDSSHGMSRVEVSCEHCGCHLGHVFDDGPRETTGKRYCINSLSLDFEAAADE